LAHQILGNVESQIEFEKIVFSKRTYKLKGMSFIIKKNFKFAFCEKNNLRFDCKSFSNLVEMMKDDLDFEKKLKEFQDPFE